MTSFLGGSVGAGGINRPSDVAVVQRLLNRHAQRLGFTALPVNGVLDPLTAEGIRRFQRQLMNLRVPDGRVDPQGKTIRALDGGITGGSSPNLVAVATGAPDANQGTPTSTGTFRVDAAIRYLVENASATSQGLCAKSVRLALRAGGITVKNHPLYAKDYGPHLLKHGFAVGAATDIAALKGDIAVIQPYTGGNPAGHITLFDGTTWWSDFKQRDMWAGPGYRKHRPLYAIYRWKAEAPSEASRSGGSKPKISH